MNEHKMDNENTIREKEIKGWINPWVNIRLRNTAVNRLNILLERDEAKPIVKDGYDEWDESEKKYACPSCSGRVHDDEAFCKHCGQRLDTENYAL